jgi:hypothetical protein
VLGFRVGIEFLGALGGCYDGTSGGAKYEVIAGLLRRNLLHPFFCVVETLDSLQPQGVLLEHPGENIKCKKLHRCLPLPAQSNASNGRTAPKDGKETL